MKATNRSAVGRTEVGMGKVDREIDRWFGICIALTPAQLQCPLEFILVYDAQWNCRRGPESAARNLRFISEVWRLLTYFQFVIISKSRPITVADPGFAEEGADHGERAERERKRGSGGEAPWSWELFCQFSYKKWPKVKDFNENLPRVWGRLFRAAMTSLKFWSTGGGRPPGPPIAWSATVRTIY